jgi:hypothetical protein
VLSTLNGTVIAFRDRETATFYLSPVILGNQKPPEAPVTLTKALVAVQIAAIEDCARRAKEEGWDGSETPSPKFWQELPGPTFGGQPTDSDDAEGGTGGSSPSKKRRKCGGRSSNYDVDGISTRFPVSICCFRHISPLIMVAQLIDSEKEVSLPVYYCFRHF